VPTAAIIRNINPEGSHFHDRRCEVIKSHTAISIQLERKHIVIKDMQSLAVINKLHVLLMKQLPHVSKHLAVITSSSTPNTQLVYVILTQTREMEINFISAMKTQTRVSSWRQTSIFAITCLCIPQVQRTRKGSNKVYDINLNSLKPSDNCTSHLSQQSIALHSVLMDFV
jgi:hypothetical protein